MTMQVQFGLISTTPVDGIDQYVRLCGGTFFGEKKQANVSIIEKNS
jgi:hypothetical protein